MTHRESMHVWQTMWWGLPIRWRCFLDGIWCPRIIRIHVRLLITMQLYCTGLSECCITSHAKEGGFIAASLVDLLSNMIRPHDLKWWMQWYIIASMDKIKDTHGWRTKWTQTIKMYDCLVGVMHKHRPRGRSQLRILERCGWLERLTILLKALAFIGHQEEPPICMCMIMKMYPPICTGEDSAYPHNGHLQGICCESNWCTPTSPV